MTGVQTCALPIYPSDEMIETHQQLRMGSTMRWVTFRMSEDWKSVIVDRKAARESTWEEFVKALEDAGDCRYGAFSLDFEQSEGQRRNKLVSVLWTPSQATVRSKMLYAATKDSVKRALVGTGLELQAGNASALELGDVFESLRRIR
mgnify:CR=1 FL=1